jgi:hypothetical protein
VDQGIAPLYPPTVQIPLVRPGTNPKELHLVEKTRGVFWPMRLTYACHLVTLKDQFSGEQLSNAFLVIDNQYFVHWDPHKVSNGSPIRFA